MNPKKSGLRRLLEPEMLVALSAVVIGVSALGVSLYETHIMRQDQRASVWPLVELSRSYLSTADENPDMSKWRLYFMADNVGIGPARIRSFRVTVDGIEYPTWNQALQQLLGLKSSIRYGQSSINQRTVPAGSVIRMLDLHDKHLIPEIVRQFDRLDYEACYCSVYDECWMTSFHNFGNDAAVQSCPNPEVIFRE